ncbi:MAG: nicotinamide-nucleotide amidohydrolase family protein [Spirochaetales bacterium]|nr:nicotinamide-nucleotide amidohydrolase family protein [Spirochaetales bacterium]
MNTNSKKQSLNTCSIIALGTELTRGIVQDKHTVFLSQELRKLGITVKKVIFLPDEYDLIKEELQRAVIENNIVILSGGLGPTSDDLTREIVADVAKVKQEFCESAWDKIKIKSWGKSIPESNKKQAYIPSGFTCLDNSRGTACGFIGKIDDTEVIVLPGPPVELQRMFLDSVVPALRCSSQSQASEELVCSAYMVSESYLEDTFQKVKVRDVLLQTRLAQDRVVCTLYNGTKELRAKTFTGLQDILGEIRFRKGDRSLPESVLELLIKKNKLIVFAESCTGGLLSTWITDIPGSSQGFWGSFITYSNEAKINMLGVDPALIRENGAVSEQVVSAMAQNALSNSKGDISIAVSGIAGPEGGSEEKPVGTVWIAVRTKTGINMVKRFHFYGTRDVVRKKTGVVCFFFAESALLGNNVLDIPAKW